MRSNEPQLFVLQSKAFYCLFINLFFRRGGRQQMDSPPPKGLSRKATLSRIGSVRNLSNSKSKGPTGRISLVFTDVQDSTKLWDGDQDAMSIAIKSHHVCMRNGIRKHNGYEVKTEGDAFMVSFSTAKDALKFCLQMQEDLVNIDYPMALLLHQAARQEKDKSGTVIWRGLRVRMGVHTGTPQCELDPVTGRTDYYGPMVNQAARVSGQAKGGQITISKDTFDEIRHDLRNLGLPTISDAGLVELKGISKSIRIYGLVPEKLSQRVFTASDPHAEVNYLRTITNELNNEMNNLDPDAARLEALSPIRQRNLHLQPVMLDVSWLHEPKDINDFSQMVDSLADISVTEHSKVLASSTFATGFSDVLLEAVQAMKLTTLGIFRTLHDIVKSVPRSSLYLVRQGYQSILSEIRSLSDCIEHADTASQQLTLAAESLIEMSDQPAISSGDDDESALPTHSVVMLQVENTSHLHNTLPSAFESSTDILQTAIKRLLKVYKGERVNYGPEYIPPLGHDIQGDVEDNFPTQRPGSCKDAEVLLLFERDTNAVNFCLALQTQLLCEAWPQELQTDDSCKFLTGEESEGEEELLFRTMSYFNFDGGDIENDALVEKKTQIWGGLKIRCCTHTGTTSQPTISPAGIKWYSGLGIQRCSRLLRQSYGGEVLVSEAMWLSIMDNSVSKKNILPVAVFDPRTSTPHHVVLFPKELRKRGEIGTKPGSFLDTRFWNPAAPALPQNDERGYLSHCYRMRGMTELQIEASINSLIKTRTDRQRKIFIRQQNLIKAQEQQLMKMHDFDSVQPVPVVSDATEVTVDVASPKLNAQVDDNVKNLVMTSIVKLKQKIKISKRKPQKTTTQSKEQPRVADLQSVHSNFCYFVDLLKGYLNSPMSGGGVRDLTSDDVQKLFTKKVFKNKTSNLSDLPYREQYTYLVDNILEDDSSLFTDQTSFVKISDSFNGLAAKLFLCIKNFRVRMTVAANKSRNTCELLQKQASMSPRLHWSSPGSGVGRQSPSRKPVAPPDFDESVAQSVTCEDVGERRKRIRRLSSVPGVTKNLSVYSNPKSAKKRTKRRASFTPKPITSEDVDLAEIGSNRSSIDLEKKNSNNSLLSLNHDSPIDTFTEPDPGKLKKRKKSVPLAVNTNEFGKISPALRRKSLTPIPKSISSKVMMDDKISKTCPAGRRESQSHKTAPHGNKKKSLRELPAPPTPPSISLHDDDGGTLDLTDLYLEAGSVTPSPNSFVTGVASDILSEEPSQSAAESPTLELRSAIKPGDIPTGP